MSKDDKLLMGESFTDLKLDEPGMSNLLDNSKLLLDESMLLENSLQSDNRVSISILRNQFEEQKPYQMSGNKEEREEVTLEQVENDLDEALLLRDMSPVKDEEMLNMPASNLRSANLNNREDKPILPFQNTDA